jgi:hypothetical protein
MVAAHVSVNFGLALGTPNHRGSQLVADFRLKRVLACRAVAVPRLATLETDAAAALWTRELFGSHVVGSHFAAAPLSHTKTLEEVNFFIFESKHFFVNFLVHRRDKRANLPNCNNRAAVFLRANHIC